MTCHAFRRILMGTFTAVLWLAIVAPIARAKETSATFYYLAIPTCQKQERLISVACIKLNRQGFPPERNAKSAKASQASFFSLWYSSPWEEKAPDDSALSLAQWKAAQEATAKRTLAEDRTLSQLPAPLVEFFLKLEKTRVASPRQIIAQPLFKSQNFVGWEQTQHLNILITASPLSEEERSKAILWSLQEAKEADPAKNLSALFASCGIKTQSVRYWPRYNVFLIEAGADFNDAMDTLFSPMY